MNAMDIGSGSPTPRYSEFTLEWYRELSDGERAEFDKLVARGAFRYDYVTRCYVTPEMDADQSQSSEGAG